MFDPTLLRIVNACLCLAFISLKPLIYLVLGVHFRHALTGLCCCACLYTPVMANGRLENDGALDGAAQSLGSAPQLLTSKSSQMTVNTPIIPEMAANGEKPDFEAHPLLLSRLSSDGRPVRSPESPSHLNPTVAKKALETVLAIGEQNPLTGRNIKMDMVSDLKAPEV